MQTWHLNDAKAHLDKLVMLCQIEPQMISVSEVRNVYILSEEEYNKIEKKDRNIFKNTLGELLDASPIKGIELNIPDRTDNILSHREVDLG